jgi:hypothetical protein
MQLGFGLKVKDCNILAHPIDTDPYKARKMYVAAADGLLRRIPGPHLEVMNTWPQWDQAKSPPPPGGQYLNPLYASEAPKLIQLPAQPVVEKFTEGPTLPEQPRQLPEPTTIHGNLLLPAPETEKPLLVEGPEVHIGGPSVKPHIIEENLVPDNSGEGIIYRESSPSVVGALTIEAAPKIPQLETKPPAIAAPIHRISGAVDDASSLNLSAEFGSIKGIRPYIATTGEEVHANSAVESPAAIGKHFAVMAGNSFYEGANRRNRNNYRWCDCS